MNNGDWATGVPANERTRGIYPTVTGPYVSLDHTLLGKKFHADGIEVVDADGVTAVVDVERANPANSRRKQTVVDHNA